MTLKHLRHSRHSRHSGTQALEQSRHSRHFNSKILPPIIEKQKILEANEESFFQLLDLLCKTSDNKLKLYRCNARSQASLCPEKFISLYLKDLKLLITRCCWRVTKNLFALYVQAATF